MKKQGQNKTKSIEIKEEFNEDITIQLDSIKKEVLDEGEKNCGILRDTQSITIVEHQQQQDHQQQSERIKIKSELIIDYQINNNEPKKIAEQVLTCSTNFNYPGYPGFIEAIRQAKRKKKSHDVSFEILFSYLPESVIKQHDFNLNEWWKYCLFENKDPLETDLSVVIGYLGKKLDAGASPDNLKSISSTLCLIASDKMERQIYSSSFLFSVFAKYSSVNNTNGYKTPKSSCQNNSIISSLHIGTKKKDGSKTSSVQNENVKKAKLSGVIDISDDHPGNQSPSTSLKKPTDVLNNNKPTEKKGVLLQKATDNSQVITQLMESPSTKPRAIFIRKKRRNKKENIIKGPITGTINDQSKNETGGILQSGILLVDTVQKEQQQQQQQPANNNQVIDSLTKTLTPAIKPATPVKTPVHHITPPLIPCQSNTSALECLSQELKETKIETTENLQSKLSSSNTVEKKQHQLPSANNNTKNIIPTNCVLPSTRYFNSSVSTQERFKLQKLLRPTPSENLPIHHNTPPLVPSQSDALALECLSERLKQNKFKRVVNSQSKLLLSNTVQKSPQQSSANEKQAINVYSNNVVPKTLRVVSPSVPSKLKVTVKKTGNLPLLPPCQSSTSVFESSSEVLKENNVKTTGNLQSKILFNYAAPKKQQLQKAQSYSQKKSGMVAKYYKNLLNNNTGDVIDINSISADKNNTTNSDNNSEDSIKNENNNNQRKRSQLEVSVKEENSNEIMQNDERKKLILSSNNKPTKKKTKLL